MVWFWIKRGELHNKTENNYWMHNSHAKTDEQYAGFAFFVKTLLGYQTHTYTQLTKKFEEKTLKKDVLSLFKQANP